MGSTITGGYGPGKRWASGTGHADLLAALKREGKLDPDTVLIDGVTVRAFGGEATCPAP